MSEAEIIKLTQSTIKKATGPTILLGTGEYFDYVDPDSSIVTIEDVCYGIGYEGRFAGQCYSRTLFKRVWYSSGQHSVLMSYVVEPVMALEALFHEAGEAVCGDMTGPLKSLCPEYKAIEKRCEASILSKLGIQMLHKLEIKQADVRMFLTERRDLTAWRGEKWTADKDGLQPFDIRIMPWTPDEASVAMLERYKELTEEGYRSEFLKPLLMQAGIKMAA
jgi:uncharacterized protein